MPHIPRGYSPTAGGRPELFNVPRKPHAVGQKPPVPYHGSSRGEEPISDYHKPLRQRMVDRLSVQRHEVDPAKVYRQLTGKEAKIDEYSGELV